MAGIVTHSFVDGPGIRFTVFFQGCPHGCNGCHNPLTHDASGGIEISVDKVIDALHSAKYIDGVTLSGGEPLMQPEDTIAIADAAHEIGLEVMLYTGWTVEQIEAGEAGEAAAEALEHFDFVMDGPFIEAEMANENEREKYLYRGSKNQRLIDMKRRYEGKEN